MGFFWVRMAYNAFRIVLECRPDQSLTHRDGHVCWTCHKSAPKCPLCCEDFRQKVVLMKKTHCITPEVGNVFLHDRMVGNEKAFFLPNSAGTHPLPPSTIPGGFKKSEVRKLNLIMLPTKKRFQEQKVLEEKKLETILRHFLSLTQKHSCMIGPNVTDPRFAGAMTCISCSISWYIYTCIYNIFVSKGYPNLRCPEWPSRKAPNKRKKTIQKNMTGGGFWGFSEILWE